MSNKVDSRMEARIIELIHKHGLTQEIVAQRLGISSRTVRIYLKRYKDSNVQPDSSGETSK